MKTIPGKLKRLLRNLYLLVFLNGFLAASLCYFVIESRYETELYATIAAQIKDSLPLEASQQQFAEKAAYMSRFIQERRATVFGNKPISGIKASLFHPSTIDLMTNNGACGSYVTVLSRILKTNGMKVRIGQMTVGNQMAGHMFVETEINGRWVVLDPTYGMGFRNSDGTLASFHQLQRNWQQYEPQVPEYYNRKFAFEGVRYTNWNKLPPITTGIKKVLDLFLGREVADTVSIRPYLLRNYHKLSWITGMVLFALVLYTWKRFREERHRPHHQMI